MAAPSLKPKPLTVGVLLDELVTELVIGRRRRVLVRRLVLTLPTGDVVKTARISAAAAGRLERAGVPVRRRLCPSLGA